MTIRYVPGIELASRDARELFIFLTGACLPMILGSAWVAAHGGLSSNPLLLPLCMLAPMISAIIVQKASGRRIFGTEGLGLRIGRLGWWAIAPAWAIVFVSGSLLISFACFPALLADHSEILGNLAKLSVPHSISPAAQIVTALGLTTFVGPLLNLPIFLGEEVGWRGFMNPRLERLYGRRGLVVGGVIWAVWHLPAILLGHNYPSHPWIGMLIWIPICVSANILLAKVARCSGSVIPCALAHGVVNQLGVVILALFGRQQSFLELIEGPAGLIGLLLLLAPAACLYFVPLKGKSGQPKAIGLPPPLGSDCGSWSVIRASDDAAVI